MVGLSWSGKIKTSGKVIGITQAALDTWKSKLINHLGADANTFGDGGEFSFNMYMTTQNRTISEKAGQAWQEREANHNKGVGHCWSKVIIPTLQKLQ